MNPTSRPFVPAFDNAIFMQACDASHPIVAHAIANARDAFESTPRTFPTTKLNPTVRPFVPAFDNTLFMRACADSRFIVAHAIANARDAFESTPCTFHLVRLQQQVLHLKHEAEQRQKAAQHEAQQRATIAYMMAFGGAYWGAR